MAASGELACADVVELVTDYLEDALDARERDRFERHLAECEGCRTYLHQIGTTAGALARFELAELSPEMRDRLLEAVGDRRRSSETPQPAYAAASGHPTSFPRERSVLLVVDPVNDYLSEGGAAWELTESTVRKNDVVANLKRAIEGARERGVPVIFAPMAYTAEDYGDRRLQARSGVNRLIFERKMFLAGSWGADFHAELQPYEDEIVLLPHKGIDVFETDLPTHLERLRTTHLVIAGMTATTCCESTGRRAMENGYDVTFLSDAIGSESLAAYEAAVHLSYPLIANAVLEVDEFLAGIDGDETARVQPGDRVLGCDRGEIGEVKDVVEPTTEMFGYLIVPRGLIFEKDTYIPLDAVVKKLGRDVFVNIPKLVVEKMPWDVPPSAAEQEAKRGPRSGDVERLYRSRNPSALHG